MNQHRGLYDFPPAYRPTSLDRPTLLVTYWCSIFSLVMILARIVGRYVRTLRVHTDDKWMAASILPLFVRLGLIHLVLIWGTNNMDLGGLDLGEVGSSIDTKGPPIGQGVGGLAIHDWEGEMRRRASGSKIVLGSRIAYVAFLWSQKFCITEFYRKLTLAFWSESYSNRLKGIRYGLLLTFVAISISTLTECNTFQKYWQVYPDPGAHCRQGLAPLLATTICSVIMDLLLVFFPMPAILRSQIPFKRKFFLVVSLSLPLVLVAMSIYRVPFVLGYKSAQPQRSLWASLECLASCAVANSIVLNSFVRDKGPKRNKYRGPGGKDMLYSPANLRVRGASAGDALDKMTMRRGTKLWGSDEDLIRDNGVGMDGELRRISDNMAANAATVQSREQISNPAWQHRSEYNTPALPRTPYMAPWRQSSAVRAPGDPMSGLERWGFHQARQAMQIDGARSPSIPEHSPCQTPHNASQDEVLFLDVGGLLNGEQYGKGATVEASGSEKLVDVDSIDLEAQGSGLRPRPALAHHHNTNTGFPAGSTSLPPNRYQPHDSVQLLDIGVLPAFPNPVSSPTSPTIETNHNNLPQSAIGRASTSDERIDFIRGIHIHGGHMDLGINMNSEEQMDLELRDVGGLLRCDTCTDTNPGTWTATPHVHENT